MGTDGRYVFSPARRQAYEALLAPLGVYQYVGGKVVTLLVSDGLCRFQGETRSALTDHFDKRMFEKVHPDDVQNLAQAAYKFAIQTGKYNAVYRSRLYGKDEYRYVHAVGKYQVMDDGKQVAFLHYEDITEAVPSLVQSAQNLETPLTTFLNENASAMVIVDSRTERLYYYNKAACRLLGTPVPFDSGLTFQQFFYPDLPQGIRGLFNAADMGIRVVEEPRTHRKLEVMVVSTTWEKEDAYAVYFYEYQGTGAEDAPKADTRHRRLAFQRTMFSGSSNKLKFWQDGYRGYRVWNLTKNTLVQSEGHNYVGEMFGDKLTYDLYLQTVLATIARPEERERLGQMNRENMAVLAESGDYPRSICVRLETSHGHVDTQVNFVLMRSPVDNDLYVKVSEENISQRVLLENLLHRAVAKEYDYVAYFDGKADKCRIISSTATSQDQWDRLISIEDYLTNFYEQMGKELRTVPEFLAHMTACCREKQEYAYTYTLPNKHVKRVNVEMLDATHQLFFIYRSDVTKIVAEQQEQLKKMTTAKLEADNANQYKSNFLSNMSHDLRTPLNGVLGFTELALAEQDETKRLAYLKKINVSGRLLLDLVNDTLELSRIESGKLVLKPEIVSGKEFWESLVTALLPAAETKGVHLEMADHADCQNEMLKLDPLQVKKVLLNLLSNAIKYTPAGGTVKVQVHALTADGNGYTRRIIVEDNGIGMTQEFMRHMYEPFSQELRVEAKNIVGTGLGLSIVKRIVDFMGGRITVQSKVNKGTRFTVDLPVEHWAKRPENAEQKQLEHERQEQEALAKLQDKNVLLCEDNLLNAEIAILLLKDKKMQVDWAHDGREGVEKFKNSLPGYYDLILMDVRMPNLDGYEATQAIRQLARPDAKTVPVIAMTANAFEEDVQEAVRAGMNAYTTKPINPVVFFSTLAKAL
jgi:signal transduction histidine kinase/ActR/RegA family two-component response regulator